MSYATIIALVLFHFSLNIFQQTNYFFNAITICVISLCNLYSVFPPYTRPVKHHR